MQMKSEKPTFYILSTLFIAVSSFTLQKLYSILSSSLKEERNVCSGRLLGELLDLDNCDCFIVKSLA